MAVEAVLVSFLEWLFYTTAGQATATAGGATACVVFGDDLVKLVQKLIPGFTTNDLKTKIAGIPAERLGVAEAGERIDGTSAALLGLLGGMNGISAANRDMLAGILLSRGIVSQ